MSVNRSPILRYGRSRIGNGSISVRYACVMECIHTTSRGWRPKGYESSSLSTRTNWGLSIKVMQHAVNVHKTDRSSQSPQSYLDGGMVDASIFESL